MPSIRLNENRISAILEDKKGTLWVATAGDFPVFENKLFYYDKRKRQWDTVPVNPNDSHSLFSSKVRALYEDKKGHLWIGTTEGLHRLNRSTNSFTRYPSRVPIQLISEDAWGNFWLEVMKTITTLPGLLLLIH
ncbi:MAG: two-component regulator propeller domain-containing protein [Segetibacter sp.]